MLFMRSSYFPASPSVLLSFPPLLARGSRPEKKRKKTLVIRELVGDKITPRAPVSTTENFGWGIAIHERGSLGRGREEKGEGKGKGFRDSRDNNSPFPLLGQVGVGAYLTYSLPWFCLQSAPDYHRVRKEGGNILYIVPHINIIHIQRDTSYIYNLNRSP
ncbi:hypothetical protein F5X96DRAFT_155308 [Biscogniauxia mediterranea]|nr:hypothetical protein F5X96DRAFT_155308 [Biscogniauxia mediterranea]